MDWMEIMSSMSGLKNEVNEQILNAIKHPYLNKHLSTPKIDDVKVSLLIDLLQDNKFDKDQIIHYCKALMIHQIALDTHEKVSNDEGTSLDREKKQLTVLEGDYYSGIYYDALSKSREINLIKELSYAVKEMNEQKINLVHHNFTSIDELLRCITIIESTILVHFAIYIGAKDSINIIENKCLITRLEKEFQLLTDGNESDFISQFKKLIDIQEQNRLNEELSKIIIQLRN
jgi:heptaprenyl diphosphate synthase